MAPPSIPEFDICPDNDEVSVDLGGLICCLQPYGSSRLFILCPLSPEVGRIAALSGWTNLQPITPARVRACACGHIL